MSNSDEYRPTIDIPPKMLELNDKQIGKLVTAMCGYTWDTIEKLLGPERSKKLKAENADEITISNLAGLFHISTHELFLAGMYGEMGQKVQAHELTGEILQRLPQGIIEADESELEVLAELASGSAYGAIQDGSSLSRLAERLKVKKKESVGKKAGWTIVFHAWLKGLMTDEMLAEASAEAAEAAGEKSREHSDADYLRKANAEGGLQSYRPDKNEWGLVLTEAQIAALREVQSKWEAEEFSDRGRRPKRRSGSRNQYSSDDIEEIRREHLLSYD